MTIHWKAVEQYFTVMCCLFFILTYCVVLENLSVLDLAASGVKGLTENAWSTLSNAPDRSRSKRRTVAPIL